MLFRRLRQTLLLLLTPSCLPVLAVFASWLPVGSRVPQILREMRSTVLPDYIGPPCGLCLPVAVGVVVVGLTAAAAVTLFDFPGRRNL